LSAPRLVVFFDAYPHMLGGAQRMAELVASRLGGLGWDVEVDVPAEGRFTDALRAERIPVRVLDVPPALAYYGRSTRGWRAVRAAVALPRLWLRVARQLRGRATVVHVDDHRGLVLVGPAARLARVPVVWHVHSVQSNRSLNVLCALVADRTVVPSRAVLSKMPGLEARRPATVIPNALPSPVDAVSRPAGGPPTVVTVGRLHPDKGIDVLLRAAHLLRRRYPTLRVVVVGPSQDGWERYEQELRGLCGELGLDDIIEFTGFLDRPSEKVATASIYVQPARDVTEVQPIAVLEAMAQGMPVVATTAGGLRELIDDGDTGLLVAPDDPVALTEAIARLIEDPSLACDLGARAAERVRRSFDADSMLDALVAVYRSLE
jgi:glycosyltransferase involved in cell wall biosynthesis